MAADASIYSLIQQPKMASPMENYGGALQLKGLIDQQGLHDLQRKQLVDADQENQRIRDLFSAGRTPTEADVFAASPKMGLSYQKTLLENKKTDSEIAKNKVATMRDTIDIFRNALGPVNDQNTYAAWRASFIKEMPQFGTTVPEQFSLDGKRDLLLKGEEIGKQLTPHYEKIDIGGQIKMVDTNPITNPAIKGTQYDKTVTPGEKLSSDTTRRGQDITQATTQRGQNMTDARERDVGLQGSITAAREGAKNTVEAQAALPQTVSSAERGIKLVDELIGTSGKQLKPGEKAIAPHPGFEGAVGASLGKMVSPFWAPPGTDRRNFETRLEEIKGGAFMQAFQSLRGGGQITEKEGEKATAAITRMSTAQSEGEFVKAAREFQDVLRSGVDRAKAKATGPYAPGQTASKRDGLGGVLTQNADGSFNYGF